MDEEMVGYLLSPPFHERVGMIYMFSYSQPLCRFVVDTFQNTTSNFSMRS